MTNVNSFHEDHSYAPPLEIEEEVNLTSSRNTHRNRRCLLFNTLRSRISHCFCRRWTVLLVTIFIFIILAVIFPLESHSTDDEVVDLSGTIQRPTVIEHYDRTEIDILNRLHIISGQAVYEQNSPQYQAANWIIKEDLMITCVTDPFLTQRYLLVILYFQSEGRLTEKWQTWLNIAGSECYWDGIDCNGNGAVYAIKLDNRDLVGSIPTEIGEIDQLKNLDLSFNKLTGIIPQELGNLNHLESLILNQNVLMGSMPDELCRIRELIVACGEEMNQVRCSCCTDCVNKNLEQNVDTNVDKDESTKTMIVTMCTKISGEKVSLRESPQRFAMNWMINDDNFIADVGTPSFVERYVMAVLYYSLCEESLEFHSWLSPNDNHCSFKGIECNADQMITRLTFERMYMVGTLPPEISELNYITFIDMSHNSISGVIPPSWNLLINLQTLLLIENEITGPLPLCSLSNIKTIEVDCDKISCTCCRSCLAPINESTILQHAPSPTFNKADSTSTTLKPTQFPMAMEPTLFPIPFFEHTDGAGRFRPDDARSKEIRMKLQDVSTTSDYTPDANRKRAQDWIIYEDLNALTSTSKYLDERYILAVLYFVLDGTNWTGATRWLSQYTYCYWEGVECDREEFVKAIDLSSHNLRGTIPYEIAQLFHLDFLDLSSNHLQESIIKELGEMSQLGSLILYDNEITGEVPYDVCMLREQGTLGVLWVDCEVTCPQTLGGCCTRCGKKL